MGEDIHNLLGKFFTGQVTKEEEVAVLEWKDSSRENAHEFELLQKIWTGMDDEPAKVFNTQAAWKKLDATIQAATPKKAPVITMARFVVAVAASMILIAGFWWLSKLGGSGMETVVATAAVQEVKLDDGSLVYLRKGSKLEYPRHFEKDSRQVSLEGEAFFDVTKDPARTFSIKALEASVQVLGTSFSVNTNVEGVSLVVKSGRVRFGSLTDSSRSLVVTAGEKALLNGSSLTKESNQDINFNAWQSGHLVFSDTPLEDVVRSLNQTYGVHITIRNEDAAQIAAKGVTIEFRNQSLASVLKELQLITTYNVRQTGDTDYEISIK